MSACYALHKKMMVPPTKLIASLTAPWVTLSAGSFNWIPDLGWSWLVLKSPKCGFMRASNSFSRDIMISATRRDRIEMLNTKPRGESLQPTCPLRIRPQRAHGHHGATLDALLHKVPVSTWQRIHARCGMSSLTYRMPSALSAQSICY